MGSYGGLSSRSSVLDATSRDAAVAKRSKSADDDVSGFAGSRELTNALDGIWYICV
jgi:hypothetical protein